MDYAKTKYEDQKAEVREIIEKYRSEKELSDEQCSQIYSVLSCEKCISVSELPHEAFIFEETYIAFPLFDIIMNISDWQSIDLSNTQIWYLPESISKLEGH